MARLDIGGARIPDRRFRVPCHREGRWRTCSVCARHGPGDRRNRWTPGCPGGKLQEGLAALLCFLSACGESYACGMRTGHAGDNIDLFPEAIAEWAYRHSEELFMLAHEIEETPKLIVE
jgi:hypothetical protein